MLRGASALNLDIKGRMAMPARYRELLQESCDGQLVVTRDPVQPCLWLFPLPEWERTEEKLSRLPNMKSRRLQHMLIGHANDCELDGSSRLLLPPLLRDLVGIKKQVMLVGMSNKFEIWDETAWNALCEQYDSESADDDIDIESLSL